MGATDTDSSRAADLTVDGLVCWLLIPAGFGLLLRSALGLDGGSFIATWALAIIVATLAYAVLLRRSAPRALLLVVIALALMPVIAFVVVVVALASCDCNVGG